MENRKITKEEWLVGLCMITGLLLPHTNTIFLLVNPILILILYLRFRNQTWIYRNDINTIRNPLLCIMFLTFSLNVASTESKAVIASIYLMLLIFTFPMVGNIRLRNQFLFLSLALVLLSQFAYLFHISPVISFIDTYYPTSDDVAIRRYEWMNETMNISNTFSFRNGGLYKNPNQCSRYLDFLLCAFLMENKKSRFSQIIPFCVAVLFGILLTGSRTGLVVSITLIFFSIRSNVMISKARKNIMYALFFLGFIWLLTSNNDFRGLKVDSGMNDSAGAKLGMLEWYLSIESNPVYLLFGHLQSEIPFDAEYGYMIGQYGFIGTLMYALFWAKMIKNTNGENRVIFVLLLWMVSSTILLAYRAAFLAMIIFSIYYKRVEQNFYEK